MQIDSIWPEYSRGLWNLIKFPIGHNLNLIYFIYEYNIVVTLIVSLIVVEWFVYLELFVHITKIILHYLQHIVRNVLSEGEYHVVIV